MAMQVSRAPSAGQISSSEATVFWRNMAGDLMLAPDTRMAPFSGWYRIECHTVKETEFYSRRMAKQEFERFRSLKVQEHLRYRQEREKRKANCRLRLAKGCISEADEFATRLTLKNLELKDELLYKLLASEPDLSRASLEIEKFDARTIKSRANGKRMGLGDDEVNLVGKLVEGVR